MKTLSRLIVLLLIMSSSSQLWSQEVDHSYKLLKLNLNEDGSKYIRFIIWHQVWGTAQMNSQDQVEVDLMLRRSRFLAYAQVSPRFLILTHFGLNNLTASGLHPVGQSTKSSLFLHDAWAEYKVYKDYLSMGAGLHYWNGISRLSNQSTLNMLTIDAPRFNWPTIGTTDQFARHLGVYAKGKIDRLDYRLAVNQALVNNLDQGIAPDTAQATYLNDGGYVYAGYLNYQFLDKESDKLPYMVGSYLGKKKVFNVGAGFNLHPKGSSSLDMQGDTISHNVSLFGVDAFYDAPLGEGKGAITAYGVYYRYNFGPNYRLTGSSDVVGTGNIVYLQTGYLLPEFTDLGRLQFYLAGSYRQLEAFEEAANGLTVGANWFIQGHHAKISLEYQSNKAAATGSERKGLVRMQAAVFL